mgnify:CR=1 FL=1
MTVQRVLLYLACFVAFQIALVLFLGPEFAEGNEAGEGILVASLWFSPWVQLLRFPLLYFLLSRAHWGKHLENVAATDWLISLFASAAIAIPLTNISIRGDYTGSLIATREWGGFLYGQLVWGNWEFGIPDYFVALMLAILVDILVFWAFALFRKPAFKPSIRAALIVNTAIYIPVTLLFLMPYFAHKIGG